MARGSGARHATPIHTAALDSLYALMRDPTLSTRVRLTSAISASRVEPLEGPGTQPPPGVAYLRAFLAYRFQGKAYRAEWRREAAGALSYYERRSHINALKFQTPDDAEHRAQWRRILNGLIRRHLSAHAQWPQRKAILIGPAETFAYPPHHPELALAALMLPADHHARKARKRSLDQPDAPQIADETERLEVLAAIAQVMHRRLETSVGVN
jgi:hypothetical protein